MSEAREDGFVTLEAIVSLAIVALALGGYYQMMSSAVRGIAHVRLRDEAVAIALSQFDETTDGARLDSSKREGVTMSGLRWSLHHEQVGARTAQGEDSLAPSWLVFKAFDAQRRDVLELRTIRLLRTE